MPADGVVEGSGQRVAVELERAGAEAAIDGLEVEREERPVDGSPAPTPLSSAEAESR